MHFPVRLKTGAILCAISCLPLLGNAGVTSQATGSRDHSRAARKADHLLNEMQYQARRARYHAQVMENLADHPEFSWDTEGLALRQVRSEVNDMGKQLRRLQAMENTVPAADQRIVERVSPVLQEMAQNADAAIRFRNTHHGGYWAGPFMQDVKSLHAEANTIVRTLQRG